MKKYRIKTVEELVGIHKTEIPKSGIKSKDNPYMFTKSMSSLTGIEFTTDKFPVRIYGYDIDEWMCMSVTKEKWMPKKGEKVRVWGNNREDFILREFLMYEPRAEYPYVILECDRIYCYRNAEPIKPKPIYVNPIGEEFFDGDEGYSDYFNLIKQKPSSHQHYFKTKKSLFQYLADQEA